MKSRIRDLQTMENSKADFVATRYGLVSRSDIITELHRDTAGTRTQRAQEYKRWWYDNTESPYVITVDKRTKRVNVLRAKDAQAVRYKVVAKRTAQAVAI